MKAGSPIPLNIRLTNISGGELVFGAPPKTGGIDSHFTYICRKDGVKNVSRAGMLSLDTSPTIKLKSGVSHEQEVDIASACDLSQPGVYRIQLVRDDPVDRKRGVVWSNEITLTVNPQHNHPSVQRRGGDHDRAGGERGPSADGSHGMLCNAVGF